MPAELTYSSLLSTPQKTLQESVQELNLSGKSYIKLADIASNVLKSKERVMVENRGKCTFSRKDFMSPR
jgi:hypothetical protein